MNYNYPLREDWTIEEIAAVVNFYGAVEKAFESGIGRTELMAAYRAFKEIVPSKSEEKSLFKEFEDSSGYVCFNVIKAAKEGNENDQIKM